MFLVFTTHFDETESGEEGSVALIPVVGGSIVDLAVKKVEQSAGTYSLEKIYIHFDSNTVLNIASFGSNHIAGFLSCFC